MDNSETNPKDTNNLNNISSPIISCEVGITKTPKRKTIFLFPNLITTIALLCGFLAILKAVQHSYYTAGILIFVAAIFDGLDGRVARLLNASSRFGEEYDSLSDMTSFGVAPAIVSYLWVLNNYGRIGTVICGIYCVCAALRLARFNVNTAVVNKRYFQGLPSPVAATVVASTILMLESSREIYNFFPQWIVAFIVLLMGVLMVSSIPYYSFKEFDFRRSVPFKLMLLIILIISGIYLLPEQTFFALLFGYAFFGLIMWFWRFIRSGRIKTLFKV